STHNVCCGRCPASVLFSFTRASVFGDESEQSMCFIGNAGGEIDAVTQGKQRPQTIELQWRAIGFRECFDKRASRRVIIIDLTVTKVADPEFVFHDRKPPRGIEFAM